jgi:hypothetical protein
MTDQFDAAAERAKLGELSDYDAWLLGDGGRGDIGWWHDYLRAEIGRANDHWRNQSAAVLAAALDEINRLRENLKQSHRDYMDLQLRHDAHFSAWQFAKLRANAAEAEIDHLRDALIRIVESADPYTTGDGHARCAEIARAALSGEGEP